MYSLDITAGGIAIMLVAYVLIVGTGDCDKFMCFCQPGPVLFITVPPSPGSDMVVTS